MKKGIEITRALAGYTRVSYNGEEIAKHYLSATTQGTREAFGIPEDESVISWLENNFADEIKAIDEAQSDFLSIEWKEAKALVESGELKVIGSNLSQINNQGEYTISADRKKLYKRRHTASKLMFDLIALAGG